MDQIIPRRERRASSLLVIHARTTGKFHGFDALILVHEPPG